MACRYGRKLASQLRVLHPQRSELAALHLYVGDHAVILLLQVLDRVVLALVLGNRWNKKRVSKDDTAAECDLQRGRGCVCVYVYVCVCMCMYV